MDEQELGEIREIACRKRMTVSDWVRKALRDARSREAAGEAKDKLGVVRAAARHDLPTADIDQMLDEIEQGYGPAEQP